MKKVNTILLVEDNPDDCELTRRALEGHHLVNRIEVARDGVEALEYIERATNLPAVLLLDLKLPRMDGIEVLRRLKSDERTRMLPVVVLTSSREESDLVTSYRLGVNSYIVKPVDFSRFSEAMRLLGMYWLLLNEPPQ
jgi:CheY-like chemotaxis protein